ncbi:MAG: MBL fold metallo-hydrolase, partial [Propionicimonas sp.]
SAPGWPPRDWQLVSCDVGQGDATVVNVGAGQAIVVDTGPAPGPVDRCLRQLGVTRVPWLILTHLHADHAGGVGGVVAGREVGGLLYSGITEPAANWRAVTLETDGVPRQVAVPGLVVAAGQVRVEVLAVRPLSSTVATGEDSADQNDSSVVMRVSVGELTVLLSGDLEEAGQGNAIAQVADLSADVLLVPHHGSGHQNPDYLAASHASVALVSVGEDNDYGHPAARTITAVNDSGARVFRTDQDGSIAVRRSGGQLVVTTSG